MVEDGEIAVSPLATMRPPSVPDVPVLVVGDDELRRLLGVCEGRSFNDRRDMAILRLFFDSGVRHADMGGLRVEDVDLKALSLNVPGKGSRRRSR